MASENQFSLLMGRRFGPFFFTQFLGAFNNNVFKNALLILIAYQISSVRFFTTDTLINVSAGLFILPFFLFSATAGKFADKYEKSFLIRIVKACEIMIMILAAIALSIQSVAILLGTAIGGVLIGNAETGVTMVAGTVVVVACVGYWISRSVPTVPIVDPGLKINWNPFTETWRIIQFTRKSRTVFLSVIGISWFWFFGATYLAQFPNYTRVVLHGNEQVVTLLLSLFSIGIGVG